MVRATPRALRPSLGTAWAVIFVYVLASGVLVQSFVLPRFFPSLTKDGGFLAGTDSPRFHRLAVAMARRIEEQGWSAWSLAPSGQAPAGIAAAVYAATIPEPWSLLPMNALLHATAAVLLVATVGRFVPDGRLALIAVAPFILYPSSLRWTTQLHKDGFSILGFYALAYGLLLLGDPRSWRPRILPGIGGALLALTGMGLVWVVRDYMALMLHGVALVPGFLIVISLHRSWRQGQLRSPGAALLVVGLFIAFSVFSQSDLGSSAAAEVPFEADGASRSTLESQIVDLVAWKPTVGLPSVLDRQLRSLAYRRARYILAYPQAGSNIDEEVILHEATDVVRYLPRALVIALTTPVPNQWFQEGGSAVTTLMRRAAGPEMVGIYLALLALPFVIWRWRSKLDLWILLWLCAGMLVGYALVVANVGTLYRMRYPYIMMLVAIAVAGVLDGWRARRWRRHASEAADVVSETLGVATARPVLWEEVVQ